MKVELSVVSCFQRALLLRLYIMFSWIYCTTEIKCPFSYKSKRAPLEIRNHNFSIPYRRFRMSVVDNKSCFHK